MHLAVVQQHMAPCKIISSLSWNVLNSLMFLIGNQTSSCSSNSTDFVTGCSRIVQTSVDLLWPTFKRTFLHLHYCLWTFQQFLPSSIYLKSNRHLEVVQYHHFEETLFFNTTKTHLLNAGYISIFFNNINLALKTCLVVAWLPWAS